MQIYDADSSINKVLTSLSSMDRCVFIHSKGRLIGSVSQGDILRYINSTNSLDLSVKVSQIMNLNPVFIYESDIKQLKKLFIRFRVSDIAILNDDDSISEIVNVVDMLDER